MKPISSIHPVLYRFSVFIRRFRRSLVRRFDRVSYAEEKESSGFEAVAVRHESLLMRKLAGTDMELQRNKIESLRIACSLIDSVVIRPGEVFSFWHLVGKPSAGRGFPHGLQLSFGSLVSMEGGGLCQLSNLLHWMVLQTPMTVLERHRHSTDPFPDYKRTVPFGTGATVFYNYLDFTFRNDTSTAFQVCVSVGPDDLMGEIRSDRELSSEYSILEKGHRFEKRGGDVYRSNELWQVVKDPATGRIQKEKLLMQNDCRVLYDVSDDLLSPEEE